MDRYLLHVLEAVKYEKNRARQSAIYEKDPVESSFFRGQAVAYEIVAVFLKRELMRAAREDPNSHD